MLAGSLVFGLLGCVSAGRVQADSEAISADIQRARRGGAVRCAPRQLATAEANLDFAQAELDQGSSNRASEHIRAAQAAVKLALELSKDCAPKPAAPPVVVKLEESDRDGDGVVDALDRCPNTPGPPENQGCPVFDRDGDGVPDDEDRCPNTPGPAENAGCPVEKSYARVEVKPDRIEIKQQIRFKTGSARIVGTESFATLKEVAQAILNRLKPKGEEHARAVLQQLANFLGMEVTEKASNK